MSFRYSSLARSPCLRTGPSGRSSLLRRPDLVVSKVSGCRRQRASRYQMPSIAGTPLGDRSAMVAGLEHPYNSERENRLTGIEPARRSANTDISRQQPVKSLCVHGTILLREDRGGRLGLAIMRVPWRRPPRHSGAKGPHSRGQVQWPASRL